MDNISSITPEASRAISFLEGVVFPTDKSELIAHASLQGAPEESLEILHTLPDKSYTNLSKVIDEINSKFAESE